MLTAISQKPGQNHEVGVRPRTPTQMGPSGLSVLMGVLVCLTCFFPMLSGEVEGKEGSGRCGHRTQRGSGTWGGWSHPLRSREHWASRAKAVAAAIPDRIWGL